MAVYSVCNSAIRLAKLCVNGIIELSVLENVVKSGTTMVMVTHNEEITRMAHRVVRMRGGRTYDVTINRHPVPAVELVW